MVEHCKIPRHIFYFELSPIGRITIQKKMRNWKVNCTPRKTVTGRFFVGEAALLLVIYPVVQTTRIGFRVESLSRRMSHVKHHENFLTPHLMTP